MKKQVMGILLVFSIFLLVGCKKEEPEGFSLSAGDVQVNTLLIGKDGSVQSSLVEEFDKDYYDKDELKSFIDTEIEKYTKVHGEGSVLVHSLEQKENVVSVVFDYHTMEDYERFNHVEAKYYTMEQAIEADVIPESMMIVDKDGEISKTEVEKKEKYKVIVVNEELDIVVNGTIQYYENAAVLNKTTVQSTGDGTSVIVFK